MARWRYTLNFKPWWDNKDISVPEKGKLAAQEINKMRKRREEFNDSEIEEISEAFEDISSYMSNSDDPIVEEAATEEFDYWLRFLYDWADARKVWVATQF